LRSLAAESAYEPVEDLEDLSAQVDIQEPLEIEFNPHDYEPPSPVADHRSETWITRPPPPTSKDLLLYKSTISTVISDLSNGTISIDSEQNQWGQDDDNVSEIVTQVENDVISRGITGKEVILIIQFKISRTCNQSPLTFF
jgi:hypothetical protein